ncbi:hypothetical protein [Streptomyces sp. NBC_00859]|nr:hypothetical protein OG584_06495 [Streptomyces sp. NBC_00859]
MDALNASVKTARKARGEGTSVHDVKHTPAKKAATRKPKSA